MNELFHHLHLQEQRLWAILKEQAAAKNDIELLEVLLDRGEYPEELKGYCRSEIINRHLN